MSRRKAQISSHTRSAMELYMDCQDEELTPWQIKAYEHAKHLFRESQKIIKSANNGIIETTVPVTQVSTPPAARSMPPPPAQAQRAVASRRSRGRTTSPEIIVLDDDDPPAPGTTAAPIRGRNQPMAQPPGQPVPQRPPVAVMNLTSVRPVMMQQQMMVQDPSGGFRPILPQMPKGLVPIQLQNGLDNVFQIPQGAGQGAQFQPVPGTHGMGVKRVTGTSDPGNEPDKKKVKRKQQLENRKADENASWVPLDEYYYGKKEGDPSYREEKKQFRFKCWYCHRMLYNNLKLMAHIQGHIDSEKQQNLDLMDLTQCKFCYRQFDTPFEMQCHIEKVHQNKTNVLVCRICERDCETQAALRSHMTSVHQACEMPYVCQLCNFRSSIYNDVVDHFKKRHDSSKNVMCLYCLRVFKMTLTKDGVGKTAAFYQHIQKHQVKNAGKKCSLCTLSFLNKGDLVMHQQNHHRPNHRGIDSGMQSVSNPVNKEGQVMIRLPDKTKSLNVPSSTKVRDYKGLMMPKATDFLACYECNSLMSQPGHYRNYVECSLCRYATVCSIAYSQHMLGYHKGGYRPGLLRIPKERPLATNLFCWCGFSSNLGNTMANHLVSCSKRTCYSTKPVLKYIEYDAEREDFNPFDPSHDDMEGEMSEKEELPKKEMSLFDALGLVKRNESSNSSPKRRDADMTPEDIALDVMNQIVDTIAGDKLSPKHNPNAGARERLKKLEKCKELMSMSPSPGADQPRLNKPRRYLEVPQKKKPSVRSIFLGGEDKEEEQEQAETDKKSEENSVEESDSRGATSEESGDTNLMHENSQEDVDADLVSYLSAGESEDKISADKDEHSTVSSEQVEVDSKSDAESSVLPKTDGTEYKESSTTNINESSLQDKSNLNDESISVEEPSESRDKLSPSPVMRSQDEEPMETEEQGGKLPDNNATSPDASEAGQEIKHVEPTSMAAQETPMDSSHTDDIGTDQTEKELEQTEKEPKQTDGVNETSSSAQSSAEDHGESSSEKQQVTSQHSQGKDAEEEENLGESMDSNNQDEVDLKSLGKGQTSQTENLDENNCNFDPGNTVHNHSDGHNDENKSESEMSKAENMKTCMREERNEFEQAEEAKVEAGNTRDSTDSRDQETGIQSSKDSAECDGGTVETTVKSSTMSTSDNLGCSKSPLDSEQQGPHPDKTVHTRDDDRSRSQESERGDYHSHRDDRSRDRWQHGGRDNYSDKRYDNRDYRHDDRRRGQDRYREHSGGYQGNYHQGSHSHYNDRHRYDDHYNDRHGNRGYNQGYQQGRGHRDYYHNDRGHQRGQYHRNDNRGYRGGYQGGNRGYY